jgi:hypothetical protein
MNEDVFEVPSSRAQTTNVTVQFSSSSSSSSFQPLHANQQANLQSTLYIVIFPISQEPDNFLCPALCSTHIDTLCDDDCRRQRSCLYTQNTKKKLSSLFFCFSFVPRLSNSQNSNSTQVSESDTESNSSTFIILLFIHSGYFYCRLLVVSMMIHRHDSLC